MDKKERSEMETVVSEFLTTRRELKTANERLSSFKASTTEPRLKGQYESFDAFELDQSIVYAYQTMLRMLEAERKTTRQRFDELTVKVKNRLPAKGVWFKFGAVAVGIELSNWGGHTTTVKVRDWGEDLPSLVVKH